MKKTPRFLFCNNPLVEQTNFFILCTRKPKVLFEMEIHERGFEIKVQDVYSGSEAEVNTALEQARSWYIAYLAESKK